jgi:hypothetical protein
LREEFALFDIEEYPVSNLLYLFSGTTFRVYDAPGWPVIEVLELGEEPGPEQLDELDGLGPHPMLHSTKGLWQLKPFTRDYDSFLELVSREYESTEFLPQAPFGLIKGGDS